MSEPNPQYKHTTLDEASGGLAEESKLLWKALLQFSSVDYFKKHISCSASGKSLFLGFADITTVAPVLVGLNEDGTPRTINFPFKIRGIQVKSIKGKATIDYSSEKGSDGKYYENCMTLSGAGRQVITAMIFRHLGVMAALEEAAQDPKIVELTSAAEGAPTEAPATEGGDELPAADVTEDNPFEGTESASL